MSLEDSIGMLYIDMTHLKTNLRKYTQGNEAKGQSSVKSITLGRFDDRFEAVEARSLLMLTDLGDDAEGVGVAPDSSFGTTGGEGAVVVHLPVIICRNVIQSLDAVNPDISAFNR